MSYTQLTQDQRYQIYACMKADWTQLAIAAEIGVHPSTISRELSRNRGGPGYRPKQAQHRTEERKLKHVTIRIEPQTWALIENQLHQDWSPQQVAGWLSLEKQPSVSHEHIYQHIYADKAMGGDLHQHLRCRKQRRKRYVLISAGDRLRIVSASRPDLPLSRAEDVSVIGKLIQLSARSTKRPSSLSWSVNRSSAFSRR